MHEELDNVLGSRTVPSYDDLAELHFLENCIKESLRLYPSVPLVARTLDEGFCFVQATHPTQEIFHLSAFLVQICLSMAR